MHLVLTHSHRYTHAHAHTQNTLNATYKYPTWFFLVFPLFSPFSLPSPLFLTNKMKQNPILIPEISHILCSFVDTKDLLNLALTCRALYHTSCFGLWNTLNPKSHRILRKIKNTLDHTSTYNKYVWKFCLSSKQDIHHLERFFFDHFLFPNLRELKFSNAAAQDHILYPMIASAQKSLSSLNLSKCYCLSTTAIKPLLSMSPHQLESLVLYGCGKMDSQVLVEIIHRHCRTLKRLRLTDVNDAIMDAIQHCKKLNDLGLEHCSDISLSTASLTRFFASMSKNQVQLTHLRLRDIDSLTCQHLRVIAKSPNRASLVHFDMSECNRINAEGISWLATECINLHTLLLAYQEGVTNQAIQASLNLYGMTERLLIQTALDSCSSKTAINSSTWMSLAAGFWPIMRSFLFSTLLMITWWKLHLKHSMSVDWICCRLPWYTNCCPKSAHCKNCAWAWPTIWTRQIIFCIASITMTTSIDITWIPRNFIRFVNCRSTRHCPSTAVKRGPPCTFICDTP